MPGDEDYLTRLNNYFAKNKAAKSYERVEPNTIKAIQDAAWASLRNTCSAKQLAKLLILSSRYDSNELNPHE